MPVYRYEDYRNPYGPSIADVLGRQGDTQATLALQQGALEAQAARDRGALWGGVLDTVGQTAAAIPQHQLMAREAARREQVQQMQLDALKREQRTRNVFEAELRNPANYNDDGSPNDERITKALQMQDVGAWQQYATITSKNAEARLALLKTRSEIEKNISDVGEKQQKRQDAQQTYLSKSALAGLTALDANPGDPLHVRDTANAWVADAIASQAVDPAAGRRFLLQTATAGPDQLRATLLQFADPELKAKVDKEQAETAASRATARKPIAVNAGDTLVSPPDPAAPDAPPTVYYTAPPKDSNKPGTVEDWVARDRRLAVAQNGGVPLTDEQLRAVDARALQAFKVTNQDPEAREAALANKNLATLVAQMKYDQRLTPEMIQSTAEDLASHRISPSQVFSMLSSRGQEGMTARLGVIAAAKKYDPTFNVEEAESNYQLVKSPAFQNTVRYMDSVTESIPRLLKNASALGRGPITSLNQLANMAASEFNSTDLARLKTDAVLVGDEVAKLLAGGGSGSATSDAKMKQGMELINTAASVPVLAAALQEITALVGFRRLALTRGTYLEGTAAGPSRAAAPPPASSAPSIGETRTANGETRVWDGQRWQPVK